MYRIWIDQDAVIYDMNTLWYAMHNEDFPNHIIRGGEITEFRMDDYCERNGCKGKMLDYFDNPRLWLEGKPIADSKEIIARWIKDNVADLGILTSLVTPVAATPKLQWLEEHFPSIKDVLLGVGHLKHLVIGDILIDDGIHNLTSFTGIGILYSQPWNRSNVSFPRAKDWKHVDYLVRKSIELLKMGLAHKQVELILRSEQDL